MLGQTDDHVALTVDDRAALAVWISLVVVRDVVWTRITRRTADRSLELWRQVAVAAPDSRRRRMTLAAFAAWLTGDGAQAHAQSTVCTRSPRTTRWLGSSQSASSGGLDPRTWVGLATEDVLRAVPGLS